MLARYVRLSTPLKRINSVDSICECGGCRKSQVSQHLASDCDRGMIYDS